MHPKQRKKHKQVREVSCVKNREESQHRELVNLKIIEKQQKRGTSTIEENFHAPKKDLNLCPKNSAYQNF